jgi:ornithine decarboxylase
VSFHVGSGNSSDTAYYNALKDARDIFDRAEAMGFKMDLLDIGGGFPGTDPRAKGKLSFEDIAKSVRHVIDDMFPAHVRVIAEPGRFFAESPYALAMAIHSKRKLLKTDGSTEHQYYTSDGKYGSFNCMIYDHAEPTVEVLRPDPEATTRTTTIFGPTCDGIDWIMQRQKFPALDIGDWIFCPDFGAYTVAAGSAFNGFKTKRIEYVTSMDVWKL